MKRFILFLIVVLMMSLNPVCCLAKQVGDFGIGFIRSEEAALSTYYGNETDLVIPSSFAVSYGGEYDETYYYPLTWINEEAFIYNTDLKTVVIPEGVTGLGYRAFYGCENLEAVVLPSTIRQIEEEAFANCTNLTRINLPDELYYAGENVFAGCNKLQLTKEEKDVLTYTEYAARMAQQEAFVVDTENLIDLSSYLGTGFYDFVEMMGDMEDARYTSGIGYANYDVSIASNYANCNGEMFIGYIGLEQKSNYCLMGVYVSMDSQDAVKTLLNAGWKMTDKWALGSSFEDPNGNSISFWSSEDNTVISVTLYMNDAIASAVSEGDYDIKNLFVYPD